MITIKLPRSLVDRVNRRLLNSNFKSAEDYVEFVLNQVLLELEGDQKQENQETDQPQEKDEEGEPEPAQVEHSEGEEVFSEGEKKEIEARFKDLGYM